MISLCPQGRTDENDNISPHKEHIDPSNGPLDNGFVRFGVNFRRGDRLLDFSQDHVEMLIVGLFDAYARNAKKE